MKTTLHTGISTPLNLNGVALYPGLVGPMSQARILNDLRSVIALAPLFSPQTPYGKPMSVRLTSAGKYGWFSDRQRYQYVDRHPSGRPWPPIPASILEIWHYLGPPDRQPDCCLINFYGQGARMGLHQDKDEADFGFPVVSVSLGDDGLFRVGGTQRGGKTKSIWLQSGDVAVLSGAARLAYHGVDRIRFGSSTLLPNGGRINLTMRVVD